MKNSYRTIVVGIIVFLQGFFPIHAQPIKPLNASELQQAIKKLTVLGSVLYLAAHPDDENTRVIAYFANGRLMRTGYLAMTRGDGGQNLIGSEKGELLGLIRTRELLAAREIDSGEQFFTRAIDFGYSKSPDETLEIWDREKILADVVWVIRKFRPDVIITRFTPELGGHGHHRASAILAEEAFHAAGDSTRFPEQLQYLQPWQPGRIYWNAWRPALEREGADLSEFPAVDVGEYDPVLGQSYYELAAKSRSMHKSQGFGMEGYRGTYDEYFQYMAGDMAREDLFEGVNTTWSRIEGGEAVGKVLREASQTFDPQNPSAALPFLLKAYRMLDELPPGPWVKIKRRDLNRVIRACAGIWYEAIANDYSAPPGSSVTLIPMIVNRSDFPMTLEKIRLPHAASDTLLNRPLPNNEPFDIETSLFLPENTEYSQPYWLQSKPSKGTFEVADLSLIGLPENSPQLSVKFTVLMQQTRLEFETPVLYRWRDPVEGELYRPLEVIPPVTVNFENNLFVFGEPRRKEVRLRISAGQAGVSGTLRLKTPLGWISNITEIPFSFEKKDEEIVRSILITPPATPMTRFLTAEVEIKEIRPARSRVRIEHSHIPIQVLFPPAELQLVRIDLKKVNRRIGYIMGSGDEIPEALRQIGYDVTLLSDDDLSNGDLKRFDVIITGIRAYNTRDRLKQSQNLLMDFVKSGGTLIVQYNVFGLVTEELGPYPFKISRDRVSVEEAPVEFLDFAHSLFTFPNQILQKDFSGWVQERGLYFANEWDRAFLPLLSSRDPGEEAKKGGLLYARYGSGVYIYTGYSWFRQLPAGVHGAYRFFVNMISAGAAK
jgi:LmbE family N-acetylglucosaminyl deacetylase